MTRQTFDINFYCRKSKADKDGFAPVELSIIINGERCYLRLQRKERPEEFKKAMESKKSNDLKGFIEKQRILINKVTEEMAFAEVELTAENLKECLKKGGVPIFYSLGQLWKDILDNKNAELSIGDLSMDTYKKYLLAKKAFYEANQVNDHTPAKDITVQHLHKFNTFLRSKKMMESTIHQYHVKCKTAFTLAFESGKIRGNPYAKYRMNKCEKKEIVWLTDNEMRLIRDKVFAIGRLDNVRDLFVFQCNSGLSYADLSTISRKDFQKNDSDQTFIEKRREKTGERYLSVVLKDGLDVLERHNYNLPILSNQKYNSYLKEIQDLCGIEKTLTTHIARKTYICFLFNRHIHIETIAAMVGHHAAHTTLKYYAKMDKQTVFDELREKGVANDVKSGKKKSQVTPERRTAPKTATLTANTAAILDEIRTRGIPMSEGEE